MASTKARGYGHVHQQIRRALLAAWTPGDPCTRCHQPMWGPPESIHLGHTDDRTAYNGLEHASCNTADGARRGNRQRSQFTVAAVLPKPQCEACGKTYHYGARTCSICGRHYHPTYGQQRTCGRACGVQLRLLTRGYAGNRPPAPKAAPAKKTQRSCAFCGKRFMAYTARYCSDSCGVLAGYYAKRTTKRPSQTVVGAAARRRSRAW